MNSSKTKRLVVCALFASICFVVTRFLSVPAFYTKGYVNLGDVVVLLCGFIMGGWHSAFAVAIGAALADASMGYWIYFPATFIIKGAMVLVSSCFFRKSAGKGRSVSFLFIVLACVVSEILMLSSYFLFESLIYNSFAVAFASLAGNIIQAVTCAVPASMLIMIFKNNPAFESFKKSLNS